MKNAEMVLVSAFLQNILINIPLVSYQSFLGHAIRRLTDTSSQILYK